MPRWLKYAVYALIGLAVSMAGLTFLALEGNEVVVIRTTAGDGTVNESRVWIADQGGYLWIEAADTRRQFYKDIVLHPEVTVVRGDRKMRCLAAPMTGPAGHEHIRGLLAKKYGWADAWVRLLVDLSGSIAIRLEACVTS